MTVNLRTALHNAYNLQDARGLFPNALRYEDETPLHKFVSVIGPLSGRSPFILLTARDSFDEGLCKALFLFLESHAACLSPERDVTVIEGFKHNGYVFDSVLVLNGSCHNMYEHVSDELNQQTLAAFPIVRWEFTGPETADEIDDIRHDGPCTIDWNREPSPYVLMRFCNQKTGAGTRGKQLWYTKAPYAENVVLELTEEPGSFVELRNFRGEQIRIEATAESYAIDRGETSLSVERSYITRWLDDFLTKGLEKP
jgi:hypothetical protein